MSKSKELMDFFKNHPRSVNLLLEDAGIDNEENRDRISLQAMLSAYDDLRIEREIFLDSGKSDNESEHFQVFEFRFLDLKLPILIKIDYWEYSYGSHSVSSVKIVKKVPVESYRYEDVK